ncbi:MAG: hypothetical protein ACRC7S_17295 [Cetobacterium sp.]
MKIRPERPDIGQKYKNDFKDNNQYPFCNITRVLSDKNTGAIVQELNELDSTLDRNGYTSIFNSDLHDYMVKFPKFYYKRTWNGDTLEEYILGNVPPKKISQIPKQIKDLGYEVYPCFVDPDGNIRDYILIGVFPGTIVNGQLRSLPVTTGSIYPQDLSQRYDYLKDAIRYGRDHSFNINMIDTVSMIRLLFKFSFQSLDFRVITLEKGASNLIEVGQTLKLGNRTGYIDKKWVSIFGIEGFFGGGSYAYEYVEGVQIYSKKIIYTLNPSLIYDVDKYTVLDFETPTINTSVRKIQTMMRLSGFLYMPATGSTSTDTTTHWASGAYYYYSSERYLFTGGTAYGVFSFYLRSRSSTEKVLSRLMIKPSCL